MTIDTDPLDLTSVVELIEAARKGFDAGDQEPWLARIDDAYVRIDAAFEQACREGDTDTALDIGAGLGEYWPLRSKLSVGCDWLARALSLKGGTTAHRADALRVLGGLEFARGQYEESISAHERALELYAELDDIEHVVESLCAIGFGAFIRGRRDWAIAVYEDARVRSRARKFPVGEARALGELALIAHMQGEYEEGMSLYTREVEVLRGSDDTDALAAALDQQGMVAANHGDIELAVTCLEESVEQFGVIGRTSSQALASIFLGDAERKRGNRPRARACFERAVELAAGIGDAGGEGLALLHLGRLERDDGVTETALSLIKRSCDLLRAAEDNLWCATALLELGRLHRAGESAEAAQQCFEESLRLRQGLGDPTRVREVERLLRPSPAPPPTQLCQELIAAVE